MPQLDKQYETKTKALEQYIKQLHEREKQKSRETQLLFLLLLLGLIGLYCVYNHSQPTTPNYSDYNIQWKDISAASEQAAPVVRPVNLFAKNSSHSETLSTNTMQTLKIGGELEAYLPVRFTVDSFDEAARYMLDLGNGQRRELRQKSFSYIYRQAGRYPVQLSIEYQGETRVIYSGKLHISNTIEIAEGAEQEI